MPQKILFDCDNTMGLPSQEVDDGLTLLYLLGRADIDVVGITTTFGNGSIDVVYAATQRLLRDLGREDIPVFKGEGERGQPPTDAARYLAEMAAAHPGEIAVLAIGPLGNLRAAAELDPDFFRNLKQIACMGGVLHPLRIGERVVDELNFSCDPEGASAVLHAACPVTVMNAHVCLQAPFGKADLARADFWDAATQGIVQAWLWVFGVYFGVDVFYLWDLLPAVYLSHPELFELKSVRVRAAVDDLEHGTLVPVDGDEGALIQMPPRIVDPARFMDILFAAWRAATK